MFLLSLFIPRLRTKGSGSQLDQLTLCTSSKHRLIESNGQELEIILWTLFVRFVLRLKSSISEKHIHNSELKFICFKIKICGCCLIIDSTFVTCVRLLFTYCLYFICASTHLKIKLSATSLETL